jgi:predicted MFS family arabinose efflux permease
VTTSFDEPRRHLGGGVVTFVALLVAYIFSQFYRAFLAIVAGDLSRDLGLNAADLGALSAIWFATFAVAQFPVGYSLDRFGPRRTIATFMLAAVAGAVLLSLAESRAACLLAMGLIGLGCSPVLMGSLFVFGRSYPPERFAVMAALVIGLGNAGNLLGATPLALAVEALGWRQALGLIAALTALSVVLVFVLVRDPPATPQGAGSGILDGLRRIATLPEIRLLLPITLVGYAVVIAARSLWIAPYFREIHGFATTQTGNAALAMAVAMTVGALVYGPMERWFGGPKPPVLVGSVVTGAAFVVLALFGAATPLGSVALFAVVGAAGLTYGTLMTHARLFFPADLLGRGVTFMNFFFIGGAGLLQQASGLFLQGARSGGLPPEAAFSRLHLAFGASVLLAAALYAFVPAKPRAA